MDRTEEFQAPTPEEIRRRLTRRLVAAGVLIVVLLGALAIFDQLSRMEPDAPPPPKAVAKTEPPSPPVVGPSVRTDGQYPVGAPPPPPIQPSVVEPPPKPEVAAEPAVAAPPPAVTPAARPATRPIARPIAPLPAVPVPAPAPAETVPEGTSGGEIKPAPATATAAAVPTTAARPLIQQLRRGYVLQAGVFMSTERAEEMRARLAVSGVPVTIESRVQVGPFATSQEAAAAREKIKALGIETIVIPPARARAAGR